MENVEFLLGVGFHKEQIAARLGLSTDTLDKKISRWRARVGKQHSPAEQASGQDEGSGKVRPLRIAHPERGVAPPEEQAG